LSCGLYLIAALVAWGVLYAGDLWWPATLLLFAPRWMLALPVVILAPASAVWRPSSLVPLFAGLIVVVGPVMGFNIPWRPVLGETPTGHHFRIFVCNLHYGSGERDVLDSLIAITRPDVVIFLEWRDGSLLPVMRKPGWHIGPYTSVFLASRHPIVEVKELSAGSFSEHGAVARCTLNTPQGAVTLFGLHLGSPQDALMEAALAEEEGKVDIQANSELRAGQMAWLAEQAKRSSAPVVLAGDFNTPPMSALFRRQWADFVDAFSETGWGWGFTFIARRTQVRIDYVLAGPGWSCQQCWVGPPVGSPHRPVIADLVLTSGR
jgi:endonuclease/exonuclease/phosphatase (EEP) superfamily protein YafD